MFGKIETRLPLNTINLVTDLEFFPMDCWKFYHAAFILCHVIAMTSGCCNPFLYGRFNDAFWKEFLNVCPVLKMFCGNPDVPSDPLIQVELQPVNNTAKTSSQ